MLKLPCPLGAKPTGQLKNLLLVRGVEYVDFFEGNFPATDAWTKGT